MTNQGNTDVSWLLQFHWSSSALFGLADLDRHLVFARTTRDDNSVALVLRFASSKSNYLRQPGRLRRSDRPDTYSYRVPRRPAASTLARRIGCDPPLL